MIQSVIPDKTVFFCGDSVSFKLAGAPAGGRAVLRSSLHRARLKNLQIIQHTEEELPLNSLEWHDMEMEAIPGSPDWQITVPLTEIGVFDAKCCFITDGNQVLWPGGDNFRIKVESAFSVAGNTIYTAFVRQFGEYKALKFAPRFDGTIESIQKEHFEVLPPSGTFRDLIAELDHIFDKLNCRILQLLPIHPVPVAYGKMGRYGSPFAALDYFAVDPALADFDEAATPLAQFGELIDAVHARHGRIFMDIPVNHTGWASKLQNEHPDYFVREPDGKFHSPGAWGTVWADLCKLDYSNPAVHKLMAKVFLFWCRRGVDGFRCDAGYMLPTAAWDYIVAKVRLEYPDTVFMLEGLGGPPQVQQHLLERSGLDWAYSEVFQNYSRDELTGYLQYALAQSRRGGNLVNFAETHDNNRLAATSHKYAELRFLLCALLSENGAFGFANGAEFFAEEKIDVHGCGGLNWGNADNLIALIGRLNALLAAHDAFAANTKVNFLQYGPGNVLAASRENTDTGGRVLVLLNLNCDSPEFVRFYAAGLPDGGRDLLSDRNLKFLRADDGNFYCELLPGQGLCIDLGEQLFVEDKPGEPAKVQWQRAREMAKTVGEFFERYEVDVAAMLADPARFCAQLAGRVVPPVAVYDEACDGRRVVMIPPQCVLYLQSADPFIAEIRDNGKNILRLSSLPAGSGGGHFVLAVPPQTPGELELELCCFDAKRRARRSVGKLLVLDILDHSIALEFNAKEVKSKDIYAFANNNLSSMSCFPADWGMIKSKYDAILAVNSDASYPSDRYVMLSRLRGWVNFAGYSQMIAGDHIESFAQSDNQSRWRFKIPAGRGCFVRLEITFFAATVGNSVRFEIKRLGGHGRENLLGAADQIKIILRPDIDDRINHHVTKAFEGVEHKFPDSTFGFHSGFKFAPEYRELNMEISPGSFHRQNEWQYMVDLPKERLYGLEDKTDLFSPGYFECFLCENDSAELTASAVFGGMYEVAWPERRNFIPRADLGQISHAILNKFIVKRDKYHTVIAGYPWFLDWGRDTLIFLRGAISANLVNKSVEIIRQFAVFERDGTIPNMIRGNDDRNRDTSDAPLYLIIAARDLAAETQSDEILQLDCHGRTLLEVLTSIVENYRKGTPNHIKMDEESKLIYSPSHFTWMDTNHPAGTPRQGYPIEIQSLWYAALVFLSKYHPEYRKLADEVKKSINRYFYRTTQHAFADCLHGNVPASRAVADDHNRCNQLLAITMGAVTDQDKQLAILESCGRLLVPGAIRTLADAKVGYPLAVYHHGRLLNDPEHPYRGRYSGSEDDSRKVAYHNGTAWCWPFPAYCEALLAVGGEAERHRAASLLLSARGYFESGIAGQLPEIADGDRPHHYGGCAAQAWSVSEFFRVYRLLYPHKHGNAAQP